MTLISVIIPVYNAEMHLKKCIASLLVQTHQEIEFIFINDGSTDNSKSIIEQLQKTDARIVLINQENKGVSVARNNGIAIAKGNYIGFVDADDTVIENYFEKLLALALSTNVDVVVSKYISHQNKIETISPTLFPENQILNAEFIQNQIIPYMIQKENLNAIWNKLFTSEIIKQNAITFPVGVALGEDGLFNLHVFQKAKAIYFTDFIGYHYFEIEGSATRNFTTNNYFENILKEYQYNYSNFANSSLSLEKINNLKAEKCLHKSISLIHEFTNPKNKLGFKLAFQKIKLMLSNAQFNWIVSSHYNTLYASKGKYEKLIILALKNKWIYLLFITTAYSRFRNKK
jgi:glycosyltransferase involved in cell wall biosynthesis